MTDKILYQNSTEVKSGRYNLRVYTIEKHWIGEGSGGMESMPGNFLEQEVSLIDCDNPSPIESLAVQHKVTLRKSKKKTTSEPKGYADLKHNQLVEEVPKNLNYYLQNLRSAVKKVI